MAVGVWPTPDQGSVAVAASDSLVRPKNQKRTFLELMNKGANDVWLSFGQAAVVGEGQLLEVGAIRIWDLDLEETEDDWQEDEVRGIGDGGPADVAYVEESRP